MCTSLGTTTSPNTELMSIDFRLGRKHCNERQFSARKRSMCLHSALAQDVLAPVDPWHHGGKAKLNKRNALTATIWTWVIYLSSSLWIGSHPFLGFSHWDKFKIERDFDLTHSTWTSKLMVQIYLAGQTCGKIEEISRSWWQCATANEAVKHLVLFIVTCIYSRVDRYIFNTWFRLLNFLVFGSRYLWQPGVVLGICWVETWI